MSRRSRDGFNKALEYFQQAIEKDPGYALAYAWLANAYMRGVSSWHPLLPREAYARARTAARRALELDETLAEAHAALAQIQYSDAWDWSGAEKEFQRAIELNPSSAEVHHMYSHLHTAMGRTEESLYESLKALELDPISLPMNAHLAWHYVYARQPDEAIRQCEKTLKLEPSYPPAHAFLAEAYGQKAMHEKAIAEYQKALALAGEDPTLTAELASTYAAAGKTEEARQAHRRAQGAEEARICRLCDSSRSSMLLSARKTKLSNGWRKAYQEHAGLTALKLDPWFDSLRSDPRFTDLLRRMGLPP